MPVSIVMANFRDLDRRYQEAIIVKSFTVAEPRENDQVSARRWPKAPTMNIHGRMHPRLIDVYGLDLKADHASGVEVKDGQLGGLAVWKRAK
jgi:hypothetical protein